MSKTIRHEYVVECTPEEAFDFLSDMRSELIWNRGYCQSVEKLTEGPVGVGTKYRAKWKGSPEVEVELTEFERPHAWRAHSGGALESNFECTIEPHPDGAKLVHELELIPHGFFKLLFPIFKLIFAKEAKTTTERIRNTLKERFGAAKASA